MKILKVLAYIALGIAALVAALGLFARKNYHIERSIEIDAPREVVLEQVKMFKNFTIWSPWASLDPNMKSSIEGTDGEVGAVYKWKGNKDVGEGQETIKAVSPDRVDVEVLFKEPWESVAPAFFKLEEVNGKTKVTWGFDMHIGFPWNGLAMFTDVNAGVGKDYERGLGNLKKVCDEIVHPTYNGFEVVETEVPVQYFLGYKKEIPIPEVTTFYGQNIGKVMEAVQKEGLVIAGPPCGLYWSYDEKAGKTETAAAVPVGKEKKLTGDASLFKAEAAKALVIEYYGPYDSVGKAHMGMDAYMVKHKLRNIPPVIESYITDPSKEPDTMKWLTKVIYMVAQDTTAKQ